MNANINTLLSLGKTYSKEEAHIQFDIIYKQRLDEIVKKIDDLIKTNSVFDLIFCTYAAYAKQKLPNKAAMMKFVNEEIAAASLTSCGFYKSNIMMHINYDLPNVWGEFKTIDMAEFASFYGQCCLNLYECVKHIDSYQGRSGQQLTNELAQCFQVGPRNSVFFANSNIDLEDLAMTSLPPNFLCCPEEDNHNLLERVENGLRDLIAIQRKKASRHAYKQDDFAAVIIQYILYRSTQNGTEWELIFSREKFVKRICDVVDDFLAGKNSFDHELVQKLILKIESVLNDYNSDFKMLGLSLDQQATSLAHKIAFRKLFETFTAKRKREAYAVHVLWEKKRDELLEFFVSQLSPDQTKDEENAKMFIRKIAETLEETLDDELQSLFQNESSKRQGELGFLQLQANRETTLISLSSQELLSFVLDPNKIIKQDFTILWHDFTNSIIKHYETTRLEELKMLDELKKLLNKLNQTMALMKKAPESFKAQELFQVSLASQLADSPVESEEQIGKNVYFKVRKKQQIILYIFVYFYPGYFKINISKKSLFF